MGIHERWQWSAAGPPARIFAVKPYWSSVLGPVGDGLFGGFDGESNRDGGSITGKTAVAPDRRGSCLHSPGFRGLIIGFGAPVMPTYSDFTRTNFCYESSDSGGRIRDAIILE